MELSDTESSNSDLSPVSKKKQVTFDQFVTQKELHTVYDGAGIPEQKQEVEVKGCYPPDKPTDIFTQVPLSPAEAQLLQQINSQPIRLVQEKVVPQSVQEFWDSLSFGQRQAVKSGVGQLVGFVVGMAAMYAVKRGANYLLSALFAAPVVKPKKSKRVILEEESPEELPDSEPAEDGN